MNVVRKRLGRTDEYVAEIGLGTWEMGGGYAPDRSRDEEAVSAIRYAVELGMNHIDTAEMYGGGHAEELVGIALRGFPREEVFVASKVLPEHLRYDDLIRSCEASLRRLGIKYIDLYMIHWPNPKIPLRESMKALERLYKDGKIRHIGVSNFPVELLEEARSYLSTVDVVANQVPYSLLSRSIEKDLLPYCKREKITITAYSPFGKGRLVELMRSRGELSILLNELARKYQRSPLQVALNWIVYHENVITIPKAVKREHLEENAGASGWRLSEEDHRRLSNASRF